MADSLAAVEAKAWLRLAYISQSAVIQPMVQSVKWGGLVMLECRVDAQPSASFSWTIDGVDAKLSAGLTITQLSTGVSTLRVILICKTCSGGVGRNHRQHNTVYLS